MNQQDDEIRDAMPPDPDWTGDPGREMSESDPPRAADGAPLAELPHAQLGDGQHDADPAPASADQPADAYAQGRRNGRYTGDTVAVRYGFMGYIGQ